MRDRIEEIGNLLLIIALLYIMFLAVVFLPEILEYASHSKPYP